MRSAADNLFEFDRKQLVAGRRLLAGVDEAGRGSWAGPVVAAAVILAPDWREPELDDSKRLTAARREALFTAIRGGAVSWGACAVSAGTIDNLNILTATLQAMIGALQRLGKEPDLVLVDGLQLPPSLPCEGMALVGADRKSAAVAAASICAKVLRDRIMCGFDGLYPGYGFARHKGYGSAAHSRALARLGPCPLHRRSYRPVARLQQGAFWNDSR